MNTIGGVDETTKAQQEAAELSREQRRRFEEAKADRPAAIKRRLKQMPTSARATYQLAVSGKSKANALKAMCAECCGWDRSAVRDCTAVACSLWPYRPYQGDDEAQDQPIQAEEAVKPKRILSPEHLEKLKAGRARARSTRLN